MGAACLRRNAPNRKMGDAAPVSTAAQRKWSGGSKTENDMAPASSRANSRTGLVGPKEAVDHDNDKTESKPPKFVYRAEVDGLRFWAVMPVIFYHYNAMFGVTGRVRRSGRLLRDIWVLDYLHRHQRAVQRQAGVGHVLGAQGEKAVSRDCDDVRLLLRVRVVHAGSCGLQQLCWGVHLRSHCGIQYLLLCHHQRRGRVQHCGTRAVPFASFLVSCR